MQDELAEQAREDKDKQLERNTYDAEEMRKMSREQYNDAIDHSPFLW